MEEEGQSNWEVKNIIYNDAEKSSMKLFCTLSQKYILKFQLQNCVGKKKLAHMTNRISIFALCFAFCLFAGSVRCIVMHFYLASIQRRKINVATESGVLFLPPSVIPRTNVH